MEMGDPGIVVISLSAHEPEAWVRLVTENPQAQILEVQIGDVTPTAERLESVSRLAETNGLTLRLRG
jgi:hypothetical protein